MIQNFAENRPRVVGQAGAEHKVLYFVTGVQFQLLNPKPRNNVKVLTGVPNVMSSFHRTLMAVVWSPTVTTSSTNGLLWAFVRAMKLDSRCVHPFCPHTQHT